MHGKFLTLLNPNNNYLKYNLRFYIMLIGCIKNMTESQVRKDIVKATGQSDASNILKWEKARKESRFVITYQNMTAICGYINQQIPYLNLNSDDLLTSNNEAAKTEYTSQEKITAERLGLRK